MMILWPFLSLTWRKLGLPELGPCVRRVLLELRKELAETYEAGEFPGAAASIASAEWNEFI